MSVGGSSCRLRNSRWIYVLMLFGASAASPDPAEAQARLLCDVVVPLPEQPVLPARDFGTLCRGLAMCWQPPEALREREGVEVTVQLRTSRSGAIAGLPRRTYTAGVSTPQDRADLFDATIDAIRRCPAPMSPELAGRIEGHLTFLHITYKTPKHKGS